MKRRILFVIDSLRGGGAEKITSHLLNGLDRDKYDLSLYLSLDPSIEYEVPESVNTYFSYNHELISADEYEDEDQIEENIEKIAKYYNLIYFRSQNTYNKKREEMEKFLWDMYKSSQVLKGIIDIEKPDLIFSSLINSNLIVLMLRHFHHIRTPICCSDHNTLSKEIQSLPYPFLYKIMIRLLYKKADYHISVSEQSGKDLIRHFRISKDKVFTIYNGLDLDEIKNKSNEKLDEDLYSILSNKHINKIITSGRLTVQKNQELLIRAFGKLENRENSKLLILGSGEKKEDLKKLAHDLGVSNDVIFLGWRNNPFNIISACDLFVLCSHWEGHPLVLIEALTLGVPIISTDCPSGPSEILDNGKYGVLVKKNNVKKLASAITNMISNSELRNNLVLKSGSRAVDFSLGNMLENYETFFTRIFE